MNTPNFFLIGAPKCGTTAVAKALGRHPQILMSEPKEPSYFLFTHGNPYGFDPRTRVSDLESYLALFRAGAERKIRGEASPLYIYAPFVAGEIARVSPAAKIMAILRDPVERACSMYLYSHQHDRRVKVTPADFRRTFFNGSLHHIPVGRATLPMEFLGSFGFYHRLLQPYYGNFGPNQILVLTHDELKSDSHQFVRQVLAFLEVDSSSPPAIVSENVTFEPRNREVQYWLNHATNSRPRQFLKRVMSASSIAKAIRNSINRVNQRRIAVGEFLTDELHGEMIQTYREDLMRLSERVGRDFTPWLERKNLARRPAEREVETLRA